jgi:hypothetical protein
MVKGRLRKAINQADAVQRFGQCTKCSQVFRERAQKIRNGFQTTAGIAIG